MELIKTAALARQRVTDALTDQAQTNQDLWAKASVNEVCRDANHVSVILADLRRVGTALREPIVVPGTNIKFAYRRNPDVVKPKTAGRTPTPAGRTPTPAVGNTVLPTSSLSKPEITVTDTCVTIDMPAIRIIVQLKGD